MPLFGKTKKQNGLADEKRTNENDFDGSHSTKIISVVKEQSPASNSTTTKKMEESTTLTTTTTKIDDGSTTTNRIANGTSPKIDNGSKSSTRNNDGDRSTKNGSAASKSKSSPRPSSYRSPTPPPPPDSVKTIKGGNPMSAQGPPPPHDTKLVFHCQLAHGSPTGLLWGFTNLRELYERAAECYEIPVDDILYCTLNTHKVDMDCLLGGQIGLDDFIFVHVRGQKKEVDVVKDESSLGVTITDNQAGKAFIKRIKSDSVLGRLGDIVRPGDYIERINEDNMIGKKHVDVATYLRDLPVGAIIKLRLIEPLKVGYSFVSPRSSSMSASSFSKSTSFVPVNGMQTLRFKVKGAKTPVLVDSVPSAVIIDRISSILDSYLGIYDTQMALTIWDIAKEPSNMNNPVAFLAALKKSDLGEFKIPDEIVYDLWAATRDGQFNSPRRPIAAAMPFDLTTDDDKTLTRSTTSDSSIAKKSNRLS